MPGNHLFEYAVIRVVPRVEREEFLNVGVILFCSAQKFLKTKIELNATRLQVLCGQNEIDELVEYIRSFERISAAGPDSGPIGKLPMAERFRWLTATRSTVVQTSSVHPGLCEDAGDMLDRLFDQLVK